MITIKPISRRKFIQLSSMTGSFLALGYLTLEPGKEKLVAQSLTDLSGLNLNQFILIGSDNSIVLLNHRPEMGQGTYQSIPMILAEELEVEIDKIEIRPSVADSKLYGSQMVVGSRSIQTEFEKLRTMGAAAREMLRQAAANRWSVELKECIAKNGTVLSRSGNKLTYGELVSEAAKLTPPEKPPLKSRDKFSIIGKPVSRKDIPTKTNGDAKFGIDTTVPGMLYASIKHCPQFLGKVKSFNEEEILKMPGVRKVVKTSRSVFGYQLEGLAVVADNYWNASEGTKALKIEWDTQGLEKISGETMLKDYYEAAKTPGEELFGKGDAGAQLASANNIISASYETPYQAHVPMEPMNAIVSVTDTEATFWGSTQNPNGIRTFLAKAYNLPEEKVFINYTFMGGGFGRRSLTDVAEEAAQLSKECKAPVKLIWPRDEDQTQGPFRACSLNVCRAVVDERGKVTALEHKVVAQEIQNQTGSNMKAGRQIMGGITTDYTIPNLSVKGVLQKRHIPIGYWRSVYHSTNVFAHESFIDELARATKADPLQFRLDLLQNPRFRKVLEVVGEKTNWSAPRKKGIGKGVAIAERSGAHFAQVIEVSQKGKQIVPIKITTVIDVGICINPDTVRAQTEGSIVMGLGAVYAGLTVNNGRIVEQNFDTYSLLKISQCPEIETFIIDSDAPPDGAGEAGLPTVAAAFANAVFDLTGKRFRKLPIDPKSIS
jgi:isoquinoline 1-oxidoreductase beta subunit